MTDSVLVFPPGFRVLDITGAPVNAAKIKFFETGPGSAKNVYSDSTLSTSLGAVVRTRSDGFPVVSFGSETTVLVYTDSTDYYVEITDADDVAIFPAKDNVKGAVDTSSFLTSAASLTLNIPVVSHTSAQTLGASQKGKCINANPNGGTFTETLDSAITLGDGWNVLIRHAGSSNHVRVTASQNIALPHGNVTSFALRQGEAVWIKSNGATFLATFYNPPQIASTTGLIQIVDRVSAEPGSPTAGARYIATGAFTVNTGALSIAEHDIIEATGLGTWFKITPPTDCGWVAYVQDEDVNYQFRASAWVAFTASDSVAGFIELAVQSEMEAASSALLAVTPGRQHFHPGHPKAGGNLNGTGTPAFASGDYGMGAIVDNGTGSYDVAFDTAFNDTNYWCAAWARAVSDRANIATANAAATKTASGFGIESHRDDNTVIDTTEIGMTFWGDHA